MAWFGYGYIWTLVVFFAGLAQCQLKPKNSFQGLQMVVIVDMIQVVSGHVALAKTKQQPWKQFFAVAS